MQLQRDAPTTNAPAENPTQVVTGIIKSAVTLDFKSNRCRVEREEDDYNNLTRRLDHHRIVEVGNDGIANVHVLENSDPDAKGPLKQRVDFLIRKGDPTRVPASSFERGYYYPLFFGSGVVSTRDQRVRTVNIAPIVDSSAFTFEGYRTERGRQLAILRVDYDKRYTQTNHYWIDLEHDSAIVKFTSQIGRSRGNLMICEIDYGLTTGFWLPHHWTTIYMYKGLTNLTESIAVSETALLTNIASETFILEPSPGMYIQEFEYRRDQQTKDLVVQSSYYRLNVDGSKSEQYNKVDRNPQYPSQPTQSPRSIRLIMLLFGLVLPLWLCVRLFMKKRQNGGGGG